MSVGVGVVVFAADRHEHVRRVVRSLRAQRRPPDRTVLVDLGSTPPLAGVVGDVPIVELGADRLCGLPLAAARNAGATAVGTDRIVFLDADCIAGPDLVGRYAEVLDAHPSTLACGPVRHLGEGWHDAVGDDLDDAALTAASTAPAARPVPPGDAVVVDDRHEVFWSLAFGVAAETWAALGGFDVGYVGYGAEDTDFAMRAREAGVPLAWFGGGTAFHQWHPPSRLDPARTSELVRNAWRFRRRFGCWPMEGWLRELAAAGRIEFDPDGDRLREVAS